MTAEAMSEATIQVLLAVGFGSTDDDAGSRAGGSFGCLQTNRTSMPRVFFSILLRDCAIKEAAAIVFAKILCTSFLQLIQPTTQQRQVVVQQLRPGKIDAEESIE